MKHAKVYESRKRHQSDHTNPTGPTVELVNQLQKMRL